MSRKQIKPKVTVDWTDEDTFKLLSEAEGRQCIWNYGHKDYRNKNIRDAAWREIAENMENKYM
jgi:Alcohol dehydrogenase transcription factor Myb/SANT-like.